MSNRRHLHVIVLHQSGVARRKLFDVARLGRAEGLAATVAESRSFAQIVAKARQSLWTVVVLDPWFKGEFRYAEIRNLLRLHLPVVALTNCAQVRLAGVADLTLAGLRDWITLDIDDSPRNILKVVLSTAPHRCMLDLLADLRQVLNGLTLDMVGAVLEGSTEKMTVKGLARRLETSERSLRRHLKQRALQPPNWWLRWGRVVAASCLVGNGVPARKVASLMSFGTISKLRRAELQVAGSSSPSTSMLIEEVKQRLAA